MPHRNRRSFVKSALLGTFSVGSLPWLTACGGSDDNEEVAGYPARKAQPPTPVLQSMNNFRDMAGPSDAQAYRTANGWVLQRGLIYRANEISPSAEDLYYLNTLQIEKVYDLRTPGERNQQPNQLLNGALVREINLLGVEDVSIDDFQAATAQEMVGTSHNPVSPKFNPMKSMGCR